MYKPYEGFLASNERSRVSIGTRTSSEVSHWIGYWKCWRWCSIYWNGKHNPLYPNIREYILHTVLYNLPEVLKRCLYTPFRKSLVPRDYKDQHNLCRSRLLLTISPLGKRSYVFFEFIIYAIVKRQSKLDTFWYFVSIEFVGSWVPRVD